MVVLITQLSPFSWCSTHFPQHFGHEHHQYEFFP